MTALQHTGIRAAVVAAMGLTAMARPQIAAATPLDCSNSYVCVTFCGQDQTLCNECPPGIVMQCFEGQSTPCSPNVTEYCDFVE